MDEITSEQLNTLAQQFLDMGNALLAYREGDQAIPADQDAELEQLQNDLLDKAGQLATMGAIASGEEAASAVNSLSQVNAQITQTLQGLADVQKVIDIAAAALKVVVSVISMKPGDIVDSVGGLATTCGIKI
jgi:cob(I)alamin adenosyltransferase